MNTSPPTLTDRAEPVAGPAGCASRAEALAGGSLASIAAGAGMLLLRSLVDMRSLPERLMEWLLLFVPPSLFESALQHFGFDAKRYALIASIATVLVVLAAPGYLALRAGWSTRLLACIGFGFWLLVMLVVMPLTSAGIFATSLAGATSLLAIFGYLAVGLSQAAVLTACRALLLARRRQSDSSPDRSRQPLPRRDRRAALGLFSAAAAAYASAYLTASFATAQRVPQRARSTDPQQPFLSGGIAPDSTHPQAPGGSSSAPVPAPTAASVSSAPTDMPEPAADRTLTRDTDGAVVSAQRAPGVLASAVTSNADFYVVTKNAALDPVIHPVDWRMRVDGEVERPLDMDYSTLRSLPSVEVVRTLECISNFVGKPQLAPFGAELMSTAVWKGVRVSDVLARAGGARAGAGWIAVLSADEYTTALPLSAVLARDTLLAYEMNGEVLPREHGYPLRLLVPGRYGMKNPKWIVGLRPIRGEFLDWYGQRNWSRDGVIRTMSRIDLPADGAILAAGDQQVAGVAFAGSRGIAQVEYSIDAGDTWRAAHLLDTSSPDRWVRWQGDFRLEPGQALTVVARATDGVGNLQVEAFSLPEPDGGTGWQSIDIRAA